MGRSNSRPRKEYQNNSVNRKHRSRSFDRKYNPNTKHNSHYKRHNNYRQRSRSNSDIRHRNYNRNRSPKKREYRQQKRSNSRNNTFHPKAYVINIAEFKNGIPDSFLKPSERYLPQDNYRNSKSPS